MNDDGKLLHEYARDGSQEAFAEVVRRHVDPVYSAALRRTGDGHFATEVTQQVFIYLAQDARRLADHPALAAWLHTATRNASINLMTSEKRRRAYESEAANFEIAHSSPQDVLDWNRIRPLLDTAIDALPEADRVAVVLRFLNRQSFAAIGAALRVSEDAARMRTERALDRLRAGLSRQGISSTAAALGLLVSGQSALSAPAGLAATAVGAAMASGAAGASTGIGLSSLLMTTTQKTVFATALLASLCTIGYQYHKAGLQAEALSSIQTENASLRKRTWDSESGLAAQRQGAAPVPGKLTLPANAEPTAKPDGGDAETTWLGHLQFLAELSKEKTLTLVLPLVGSGQSNLSDSFIKLFHLTPEETNAVNQSFQEARDKLGELAAQNASVSVVNNNLMVAVNSFKDQGQAVHDQTLQNLASTLGPDRFAVFQTMIDNSANPLDRLFDFWGEGTQTIAIRRNSPGSPDGEFSIVETIKSSHSSTASSKTLANPYALPANLNWLSSRAQLIADLPPTTTATTLSVDGIRAR